MTSLLPTPDSSVPDTLSAQHLWDMQLVAKMKESADKYGSGFVGGFIGPDGKKFIMTNMDDEDTMMLLPDELR